jgi:NAD(P)H-flavin reductase
LGSRAVRLVVRLTGGSVLNFNSGQYVNLEVDGVTRSYSMANGSKNGRELEFHIALLDDGAMSERLRAAKVGDPVTIHGPHGVFYLRNGEAPITMVAGGTGVAPMLSMLRSMIADGRADHEVTLCYGANTPEELGAREDLVALRARMPNLDLRYAAVSGSSGEVSGGYVTDLLNAPELEGRQMYLCGPPRMVEAARELAKRAGLQSSAVYSEEFLPSA